MEKTVIETHNLTKVYTSWFSRTKVKALDNLNLEIRSGEIFGLLGPNGSGKTTAMKILLGLIFPTAGEALVLGKSPREVAVKDRIGFLPEESYLYRFLTADETLDFYGQLFKIPRLRRKKKIDELLELMELTGARKRPVKEYSKGMARRLGFAQAIINDPDVIFLDEPTSGLDPIMCRHVKNIILDLKKQGKTILLSSHLLADVENVCDRIAILYNGKLQKIGPVDE
ncbi:MAG: ABC transporter ATP-binding protein, partial [Planctomycetota bacterium]